MSQNVLERSERPGPATPRIRRDGVRADIQGLRALAVSLVVIFHFWPEQLTGGYIGVDVFFVISGYLITAHLMRRPPRTGRDLIGFWARRIRRLLPAALLVLVATLVATRLIAPALQWEDTARNAIASAWYVENWALASQAVDYLAADTAPTPVQHYWSLSVEEQFYLLWPLLLLGAFALVRRTTRAPRTVLAVVFGTVFALSLAYSIYTTATEPARAFFITPNRAWEFAAGAAVAWSAQYVTARIPRGGAVLLAWAGILAVAATGYLYSATTPFPGYAALVPVLGTAAVLYAAAEGPASPDRMWRLPGVQWLGDTSYSIYLWHWPVIVLAIAALGHDPSFVLKVVLLAGTLVLSLLSKRHVEDRFRFAPSGQGLRRTYAFAAAGMVVVTVIGLAQINEVDRRAASAREALAQAGVGDPCFGAAAMAKGPAVCPPDPSAPFVPDLTLAGSDKSDAYDGDCFTGAPYSGRKTCTFGTGPTQVALVGNSHAGHWLPALQVLAEQNGWTITTYLVSVCNVSDAPTQMPTARQTANCTAYGEWVYDQTRGDAYDLVITSERQSATVAGQTWATTAAAAEEGYASYLTRWAESGAQVAVIQDVVPPGERVGRLPECLARNTDERARCAWPESEPTPTSATAYRWMDPLYDAARRIDEPGIDTVSVNDLLCTQRVCLPVIGRVVTYFDASHLTATYARTLAPYLDRRITRATR